PDDLSPIEVACLPKAEVVADARGRRVFDADPQEPADAERAEAEVPDAFQARHRRAVVPRRAAVARPRRRRCGREQCARHRCEEDESPHAAAVLAGRSSCPNFARATYWPMPGCATSSSF